MKHFVSTNSAIMALASSMRVSLQAAPLLSALLVGVLLLFACSSPNEVENPDQTLFVQAFLTPGEDVRLQLRLTLPPERFYEGLEDPVEAARVVVHFGDDTAILEEDPSSPGTYSAPADELPVVPGQTYRLEVTYDDRLLRARTTVPEPARVTEVLGDTMQVYGDLFGDLVHPGEFRWSRSPNAAGYVIIVEAVEVTSLPVTTEPLTAELDTLIARHERLSLSGEVTADSLDALQFQMDQLRGFFERNISLVRDNGDTIRWLRDRTQEDWDDIDGKNWSEGKKWRGKREDLHNNRAIDYWIPADSTRSDFWWLGIQFEGEYRVTLQSADTSYFDYYTTSFNGNSGADSDAGPLFHVDGGTGVFGSYTEDSFRVISRRGG